MITETPMPRVGLLDRAIAVLSPKWAVERMAWRQMENSYKQGVSTRTSETWQKASELRFTPTDHRIQMASARDRGYQAYNNNPIARTLIKTEVDNVIGDGLNYQPTTDGEDWNREAQDRYYEWLDKASVRGPDIHCGCEIPRLLWDRSRVAGDVGWVLVSRGLESRIQIIPAENIVTPDEMSSDPAIVDGIRFDAFGAPTTFYILSTDEQTYARKFTAVNAFDFVYLPHFGATNQARGETAFMQVFDILSHIEKYVDGVALAAWMATVFGLVFKTSSPGKQVSLLGTAYNSAGDSQKAVTLENGMVKYVGQGDEVAQVQAHQPMQNTPDFIRAMLRLAGMVFGMPLESFALDMSTANFASARIGLLPFYRSCRIKGQGTFGPRWSRTIRWWLSRERLRPDGDPKKWRTPFPVNFWNHDLVSNAWDYTDPVSEVQSDQLQVDAGFKSPQMVIGERGRDAARIIRERIDWRERTADLPETRSTMSRDAAPEPTDNGGEFNRELVKTFATGAGARAIMFNNVDARELLKSAGAPVKTVVAPTPGVPVLPIVADAGSLVSGALIEDADGVLVGGDTENAEPAETVSTDPFTPETDTGANPTEDTDANK
jgi:capsid protein